MQAITTSTRLHPLVAVAAISVTILSAVGVATMAGVIPPSKGQEQSTVQSAVELPKEVAPAISHPAPATKKPAVRKTAAAPRPVEPVAYREFAEPVPAPISQPAPQLAQAPVVAEALKPQPLPGQLATVQSVREVRESGDAKGLGAVGGGVVGGVVGNKLGKGKTLFTVLGAAGGALAGHQIEKHARGEKRWEIGVRLDDGTQRTVASDVEPSWRAGERVRLLDGKLLPA
jgi:outer membrane lipoprotein SlyB